jgi:hypothetical protein
MNGLARLLFIAAIALLPMAAATAQETQPAPPADPAAGLAEWEKIVAVFSHPRCANCHVADDRPRWSGAHYGPEPRVHGFNVQRGADGSGFVNAGLRCTTCHFDGNSNVLHGPPGAENWHMAPAGMAWFEQSSAAICAQIKDPARNGGRSLGAVAEHVRDDRLVGWAWQPGPGREPAPGSAEATFEALQRWAAAGSPCPSD